MVSAALVAALVGYGSTIALVLSAAVAVGANAALAASWVLAVCLAKAVGSGVLDLQQQPVSVDDTADAERYINDQLAGPPTAFGPPRALTETTTVRKARDRAFRAALLSEYGSLCAFTDRGYTSPVPPRIVGLDAAHIVPVEASGSDHPANGLLLAKDIHWAFDRGLIGVSENREIIVPDPVRNQNGNEFLGGLHGKPIREARSPHLRVLEEALAWHRNEVLVS
jgi:predicted restriction endonuclease